MAEGINTDKVIVNAGGSGADNMGGMAAVIAALGNRNEGSDNAALIAALGNRNDNSASLLPALMASANGGGFGGNNALLPIVLLALLGRGNNGVFGGNADNGCASEFIMSKLGTIEGAVPLAAAQTQNAISEAVASLTSQANSVALAQLAATSGVKDSVQNGVATLLAAGCSNTKEVLAAICGVSSKIDQNQIMDLQRQLGVAQATAVEERNHSRIREVESNMTQTVTVNQAQAQAQSNLNAQIANLAACFHGLQAQFARQGQDIVNLGTMVASGTQAATTTQVK